MIENKMQDLIDAVVKQIKTDISDGDITAIEEMLILHDTQILIDFLAEEKRELFQKEYDLGNIAR